MKANNSIFKIMDKTITGIALFCLLILIIWSTINGKNIATTMNNISIFFTTKFGFLYLITGIIVFVAVIYISFSKYGNIKLGDPDEKPAFSNFSYFSILFAAGYGVGLTYWGLAEPLSIASGSVFGLEAGSPRMAEMGLTYAFFHWGWIPLVYVWNYSSNVCLFYV